MLSCAADKGYVTVGVIRKGDPSDFVAAAAVDFVTVDNSAKAGAGRCVEMRLGFNRCCVIADYVWSAGTLNWPAGDVSWILLPVLLKQLCVQSSPRQFSVTIIWDFIKQTTK